MSDDLILERRDAIAWLTINRPATRNALSLDIIRRLAETFQRLSTDRAVRVIVLTGAGDRVFISGADVNEFRDQLATPEGALAYDEAAEALQSSIRSASQPVIAMIQGHAVGGGTLVAVACDFRIAIKTAKFGIPVAKFGFIAPVPDLLRLVHLVGPAKTRWLLMTARLIEAPAALEMGLIDQAVEPAELRGAVEGLAATLAANAPLTLKATKQMMERLTMPALDVRSGAPWYQELFTSRDFKEGLDAFFAKRKPEFRNE